MIFSAQLFCAQEKAYEKKYEEHLKKLRKIIELFVNNSLSKKALLDILGNSVRKIYYHYPEIDYDLKKRKEYDKYEGSDTGNLCIETEYNYLVCLRFSNSGNAKINMKKRENGSPAVSITFDTKELSFPFPIEMLVDMFGKWTYYTNDKRIRVKSPSFSFEKIIDNKRKISVSAYGIYGPFEKPMECACIELYIDVEKISQK